DVPGAAPQGEPIALPRHVVRITPGPDGRFLLLGDGTASVRVWDTLTDHAAPPPLGRGSDVVWSAFRDDGKQVVTLATDGTVDFWQLPRGPEVNDVAALRAEGIRGEQGGRPPLWPGKSFPRAGRRGGSGAVASPHGDRLLTASDERTLRVWDAATHEV